MTARKNRHSMRRFRRSERGLSEIIGTLMLIIIVVTAATVLAAFVASYQKQVQAEQALSHDQSLESLKVLGLVTSLKDSGAAYRNINFTLASEYINPSIVLSISINNLPLKSFWWEDLANYSWQRTVLPSSFQIPPDQEVFVSTNTSYLNNSFVGAPPLPSQYLKFDVDTALQNDFSRIFLPPVALEVASEITTGGTPIILFDGSMSFQPGGNASIVQWNWTATSTINPWTSVTLVPDRGEEVEYSPSLFDSTYTYWVNLTVTNSDGLVGIASITYTIP